MAACFFKCFIAIGKLVSFFIRIWYTDGRWHHFKVVIGFQIKMWGVNIVPNLYDLEVDTARGISPIAFAGRHLR